jgi:TonB family protein
MRKATPITESRGQRRQESNACVIVMMPLSEQSTVHNFAPTPIASDVPRAQLPTLQPAQARESLVVLTRDPALVEALKALGSEHNIVTVDAAWRRHGEEIPVAAAAAEGPAAPRNVLFIGGAVAIALLAAGGWFLTLHAGQLVEPAQDNARFFIESAQAVAPNEPQAQESAKKAAEVVSAANLELAKYVAPGFPISARQRGLSGWVDIQLLVKSDGIVSDVIITGAEPVGVFEQAAVDAVRKWRYKPVERDGHAIDQRARLRMKFALDK